MNRVSTLKEFHRGICHGNVERTANLLHLEIDTIETALKSTAVRDVYRLTNMSYKLYTLEPVRNKK